MPLIVNGKIYKTKKTYFLEMNPEHINPTQNDIDRYVYHNVKEYHDYKRAFYRERDIEHRRTIKFDTTSNIKKIKLKKPQKKFQSEKVLSPLKPRHGRVIASNNLPFQNQIDQSGYYIMWCSK